MHRSEGSQHSDRRTKCDQRHNRREPAEDGDAHRGEGRIEESVLLDNAGETEKREQNAADADGNDQGTYYPIERALDDHPVLHLPIL